MNFLTDNNESEGLNLNPRIDSFEIPKEEYQKILDGMVMAFLGNRKECDSEAKTDAYCRAILKQCTTCFKPDNTLWHNPPGLKTKDWYEKLALRLKVFGYDLGTQSLIGGKTKISQKIKDMGKKKVSLEDENARTFSKREEAMYEEFIDRFRTEFASSTVAVDELMIKRLAFLSVLNQRDIDNVSLSRDLTKEIKELAESLGVSGKQRKAALNAAESGTLEQLSTKFKATIEEYPELETMWQKEEIKLILNAVDRGTTEEFLALSWIKTLYGDVIDGEQLSIDLIRKKVDEWGI
jgi:hypothetical protein